MIRTPLSILRGLTLVLSCTYAVGCGGASYPRLELRGYEARAPSVSTPQRAGGAEQREAGVAQARQLQQPGQTNAQPPPGATDRMLVYTAELGVVVNNVETAIDQTVALATGVGGFLASRDDTTVTVRVPAPRFTEVLAQIERFGDVTQRLVRSEDVTDQYHDLSIQLTNLRAVRQRLQEHLQRANNMQDVLAIERELARLSGEIDRIEGTIRLLSNRISLSTITIRMVRRPTSGDMQPATYGTPELVLPFRWLQTLGLPQLLESR